MPWARGSRGTSCSLFGTSLTEAELFILLAFGVIGGVLKAKDIWHLVRTLLKVRHSCLGTLVGAASNGDGIGTRRSHLSLRPGLAPLRAPCGASCGG